MSDLLADLWLLMLGVFLCAMAFLAGRYVAPPSPSLPMAERLELMHARVKHSTGVIILGGLIALAVVTFAGAVDIKDATISALVVQFLNTLKDLAMGPSLTYFPRPQEKAGEDKAP